MGTFAVGTAVLLLAGLACHSLYKDRKNGKRCHGCSGCSGRCSSCGGKENS